MKVGEHKNAVITALVVYLVYQVLFFMFTQTLEDEGIVPLFGFGIGPGLEKHLHNLVNFILWPVLGSIVFAVIFPRLVAPLYLKFKTFRKNYKSVYLVWEPNSLNIREVLVRGILLLLLTIGLSATLMDAGILRPRYFLAYDMLGNPVNEISEVPLKYNMDVFFGAIFLLCPVAVGLWSCAWAFEDASIVYYSFSNKQGEGFFEIEPLHFRFNALVGGYAGLSALFYYLGAIYVYLFLPGRSQELFFLGIAGFMATFTMIPAYLIYLWMGSKHLRKGLRQSEGLTEEEFNKTLTS
ncbi:MAG: hypothetical protein ACFFCO_09070 [Promethearchaeota archaeon]